MKAKAGKICLLDPSKLRAVRRFAARGDPLLSGDVRSVTVGPGAKRIFVKADGNLMSCRDSTVRPGDDFGGRSMCTFPGPMGPSCAKIIAMAKLIRSASMGVAGMDNGLVCTKASINKRFA